MAEMSGREPSDATAGTHGAAEAGRATGAVGAGAGSGAACPAVIRRALAAHTTLTLAYVDEDGPQACAVLYATGGTTATSSPTPDHAPDSAPGRAADSFVPGRGADGRGEPGSGEAGSGGEAGGDVESGSGGGSDLDSGPALYFVTAATTRHGRALAKPDVRVAFTVQRDGQEWSELTGIQGRGRCRILAGAERAAGWRAYTDRFPFVEQSDRLRDALERTALWELRPDWLRLIDNGQGFGHKEEWQRSS
ncbi:hypothetical protein ACWGQL_36620 [Streptomyces lydicus]